MMIWLTGILCFAVGMCLGAVLFRQFKSDAARVKELEEKLSTLQAEHDEYKEKVYSHFNTTAQLFLNLTDSYREVYNHLASGAQNLCPDTISNQLSLLGDNRDVLGQQPGHGAGDESTGGGSASPPRDYATKANPDQQGTLAEDYGLSKANAGS